MEESISLNGAEYRVLKLLGKGKGGYSYLVHKDGRQFVLKQIHHEPCSYYQFGNKLEAELRDYNTLRRVGIRMPVLYETDVENERILKEYIEGDTVFDLVKKDGVLPEYLRQVREMCRALYAANLNIDYFPTNFVVRNGELYYIDYECNAYMEEWDFEHWGIRYWSQTPEFLQYLKEHE